MATTFLAIPMPTGEAVAAFKEEEQPTKRVLRTNTYMNMAPSPAFLVRHMEYATDLQMLYVKQEHFLPLLWITLYAPLVQPAVRAVPIQPVARPASTATFRTIQDKTVCPAPPTPFAAPREHGLAYPDTTKSETLAFLKMSSRVPRA